VFTKTYNNVYIDIDSPMYFSIFFYHFLSSAYFQIEY
jgi:hypothetical protein